jgi:nucleotide-binding universal stress UspA family protein
MGIKEKSMNNIITCIDESVYFNDVCHAGIWAAKKLHKSLLFLHAVEKNNAAVADNLSGIIGLGANSTLLAELAAIDEQRSKLALKIGNQLLTSACEFASQQNCTAVAKTQRHGNIVEAICDLEADARLVVIGRSGQSNQQDFKAIGSHIEQIIRHAHTPILIANKGFTEPKSFMLAYDGRATADNAVKRIIAGGLLHNLNCHLVTVKNKQSDLVAKFERTEKMLIESGFTVTSQFLEGPIFSALMDYKAENNVDMLVMGAFSHSKLSQIFLGSNTLKMIENTQLPLLVLR